MLDVETTLENVKLTILERLELQFFFVLVSQDGNRLENFSRKKIQIFYKNKNVIYI